MRKIHNHTNLAHGWHHSLARDKQFCLTCFAIAKGRPGCPKNHKIIHINPNARAPKKNATKKSWENFIRKFTILGDRTLALQTLEKK